MKTSCKSCKFNKTRTLKEKSCLKGHKALFGFSCIDYKPNYEIGYQITIFDLIDEEERSDSNEKRS